MSQNTNKIMAWIDDRLPVTQTYEKHMSKYYAPKNFNFWYFFGVLSMLMLVNQILTGIWLTMQFTPSAEAAFASVEYIMRDVEWGWLIRYMHSPGLRSSQGSTNSTAIAAPIAITPSSLSGTARRMA